MCLKRYNHVVFLLDPSADSCQIFKLHVFFHPVSHDLNGCFPINNEKRKVLKIATVLNSEWLYLVLEKHSHCS